MSVVPPIRKQILVAASQEHTFRVFTDGIDRWWPREHHIGTSPLAREVLEPGVGGRWYAVSQDGSECDIGRVLVWEPPRRLVVTWQINARWQYEPTFITEIEVVFNQEGPKRTRVELEHRLLERYGDAAAALRKALDVEGWQGTLEVFARVAGGAQ